MWCVPAELPRRPRSACGKSFNLKRFWSFWGPKQSCSAKVWEGDGWGGEQKKHAGVREAEGSNANLMRKGWEKEALRDLWTNWSADNCWASFVEAKKLCRACQLDCTGNMTLATANMQLKPLLCLKWVFMSRKRFFFLHCLFSGFMFSTMMAASIFGC